MRLATKFRENLLRYSPEAVLFILNGPISSDAPYATDEQPGPSQHLVTREAAAWSEGSVSEKRVCVAAPLLPAVLLNMCEINQQTSQYNRCQRCHCRHPKEFWLSFAKVSGDKEEENEAKS